MSPRSSARAAAAFLTAWLLVGSGSVAHAEEDSPNLAARAVKVEITVIGGQGEFRWARSLVGSRSLGSLPSQWMHADRFDPREVLDATDGAENRALACWLDLSEAKHARLYFAAPSGLRFLLRDVVLSGHMSDVDRESLAEVLELSIAALLENERTGLTRAEADSLLAKQPPARTEAAPPPTAEVVSVATATPRPFAGLGGFWAAQALSRSLPIMHGPGLYASAGRAWQGRWLAGFLSTQYKLPAGERHPDIGVRLDTFAARAGAELAYARSSSQRQERHGIGPALWVRLGAGLDLDHIAPQAGSQDSTATLTSSRWASSLVLTSSVGTSLAIAEQTHLDVQVFANLLPVAVHYDLKVGGAEQTEFSTWRLRPGIAIGLTFR